MPRAGVRGSATKANQDLLILEVQHITHIFPEDTDETIAFAAGGVNNTFGAWAEVKDNNNVTLSSKVATQSAHISSLLVEHSSLRDKVYLIELSYGISKTIISKHRFLSGDSPFLPAVQQARVRAAHVPAGETIYYRMKCETAAATCQVSFRYHYH